jgi:prefoldin alpha subunit
MSSTLSDEDQLRRLITEMQMLQNTSEVLQQRFNLLESAMTELQVSGNTLQELKKENEGASLLVPLGSGSFIRTKLGDIRTIIVGIGADVSVEMELDKALDDYGTRMSEMEKASLSVQEQLSQILAQSESHQNNINRLSAKLQQEGKLGV